MPLLEIHEPFFSLHEQQPLYPLHINIIYWFGFFFPLSSKVRAGTIFDNFLITDDEVYAEDFGDETWGETKVR